MKIISAVLAWLCLCASVQAQVIYEFTGVLPDGSSFHSQIDDGESWVASFLVDPDAVDTEPNSSLGIYPFNTLTGELSFSGGFSTDLTFNAPQALIGNDFDFTGGFIDAIQISDADDTFIVQVATDDLSALVSDALPGSGTAFTQTTTSLGGLFQLTYLDVATGEFVEYTSSDAANTSFRAYNVPEPSAVGILSMLSALYLVRRRS